ncbi:hypothetical protein SAMN05421736_108110 [Evansella caseinilytica]|uniref:Methyl-accepting chemotaxis protein n=1 Tax=Evansella caseinilytica TaxID=1503961 RepID=A0A1H3RIP5_9BACI|nr:hypothetical protein [Evansella caseinilytica]SDZ25205.1 hypothetical protein SAMN05421736_108110 [Evansella caseinilytica]
MPELEQSVDTLSSVSQETSASAEEMLAESDCQLRKIENTNNIGLQLHGLSKSLSMTTQRFKVN